VVEATCDDELSAKRLLDFHGKVVVALHQALYGGTVSCTNIEAVLRDAKMKAPG
jgi:hypothetical protein